jgi:hypothetical protein
MNVIFRYFRKTEVKKYYQLEAVHNDYSSELSTLYDTWFITGISNLGCTHEKIRRICQNKNVNFRISSTGSLYFHNEQDCLAAIKVLYDYATERDYSK